jgi:ABC-type transport system involved in multi-copper enzyme maturation permease subunit
MTWVIWRQYRVSAAIAGAILAAFAVLFLITGLQDATRWHAALASCAKNGTCGNLSQIVSLTTGPVDGPVYALTILTLAVPLLFGMFWGSPAVARERETGTVQFAWTQSVTRRRWLTVKTGWLLLAGAVFGGAVAGIVTWWYAPLNALHQNQFQQGYFDIQGIVPIGYAVFAVALGIAAGTLIGRSLPALAVTAGVFLAVRLAVTYWVRVHFIPAVTAIYSVTQSFTPKGASWPLAQGVVLPGGQLTTNLIASPGPYSRTQGPPGPPHASLVSR